MQRFNDVWQGCSDHWQNHFIHHNILLLGHTAWAGYLNQGRGVVICEVVEAIAPTMDWRVETVSFHRQYLSPVQVEQNQQVLTLEREAVVVLLTAIATYDPTQAMVIAIISNGEIEINLLDNLKISQRDCYNQVQQRWAEFQLDANTPRRCG